MFNVVFDVDFSGLRDIVGHLKANDRTPHLIEAVEAAGNYAVTEWLQTAASKFQHSQGDYARGIVDGAKYPYNGDELNYTIIHKSKHARALEDGFGPFDMKKMLQTSEKIRISKDGNRYLIIPFEHGIPGTTGKRAMPKEIYNIAKDMRQSVITGTYKEGSVRGAYSYNDAELLKQHNQMRVRRQGYKWGDKLDVNYPLTRSEAKKYTIKDEHGNKIEIIAPPHKTNQYKGMVRFQRNLTLVREMLGNTKFAGSIVNPTENARNYSSYITFRIMSEKSRGWIHPGMRAMNICKETAERIRQPILKQLGDAAKKDIALLFGKDIV